MHGFARTVALTLALITLGCSEAPPPPPPAPPFRAVLDLKQFMLLVIDPAADGVWDSVKTIVTNKGTQEIAPKTDDDWKKVESSAATVAEAANLLMLDGRAKDAKDWMAAARRLTDSAEQALKAARAKDPAAVFDAGGVMYEACRGCHRRYAPEFDTATEAAKK